MPSASPPWWPRRAVANTLAASAVAPPETAVRKTKRAAGGMRRGERVDRRGDVRQRACTLLRCARLHHRRQLLQDSGDAVEDGHIQIEANRRPKRPWLCAGRSRCGRAPVGKHAGVVLHHVRKLRRRDALQPHFRRGVADAALDRLLAMGTMARSGWVRSCSTTSQPGANITPNA